MIRPLFRLFTAFVAAAMPAAASAFDEPLSMRRVETTAIVNVHTGPGLTFPVIDTIGKGAWVNIGECTPKKPKWCLVDRIGRDGWVYSANLTGGEFGRLPRNPLEAAAPNAHFGMSIGLDGVNIDFDLGLMVVRPPHHRPPLRPKHPVPEICFYEQTDFRGRHLCIEPGHKVDQIEGFWAARISSIEVFGGAMVTVCTRRYFAGACSTIRESYASLGGILDEAVVSYAIR